VPDAGRQRERPEERSDDARIADHEGIARLAEDLLPALIAKLSTTELGELEVREGDWQVRLRRPYGVGPGEGRRASDKPSRAQPGHDGHGHGRSGADAGRGRGSAGAAAGATSGGAGAQGTAAASASSNGSGGSSRPHAARDGDSGAERARTIATSPAVGFFTAGPRAVSGTRVRAGDSLGSVDVLGVREDVVAPADGIVGATLVEAGTAVEYGQELIRLELTAPSSAEAR
jgi:biotin carboxyl carrier protein